jgi:hypothetical protein
LEFLHVLRIQLEKASWIGTDKVGPSTSKVKSRKSIQVQSFVVKWRYPGIPMKTPGMRAGISNLIAGVSDVRVSDPEPHRYFWGVVVTSPIKGDACLSRYAPL